MINVSELIGDPDFTQPNGVTVRRTKYVVQNHKLVETEETLRFVGIITIADDASDTMEPTADFLHERINVFTYDRLYITGKERPIDQEEFISDIVVFEGKNYKVDSVLNDVQYGFSRARCTVLENDVM